jgi:O-antigen ligase
MLVILKSILLILSCAYVIALLASARPLLRQIVTPNGKARALQFAWLIMLVGSALWITREGAVTGVTSLDASAVLQIGSAIMAMGICALAFLKAGWVSGKGLLPASLLIVYGFLGVAAAGYSPIPMLSVYKAGLVIVDGLLVVALISFIRKEADVRALFELTYFVFTVYLVGAAIGGVLWPELAYKEIGGLFGVIMNGTLPYMNANELGFLSVVIAVISLHRLSEQSPPVPKLYYLASLALSGFMLILSQARTSIAAFVVVLVFLTMYLPRMRKLAFPLIIAGGIFVIFAGLESVEDVAVEYLRRGATDQQLETLSGRTGLWEYGWNMIMAAPIFGHGFEAGVKYGGVKFGIPIGAHMHNAHMQVVVNSGFAGYVVWLSMILIVCVATTAIFFRTRREKNIKRMGYEAELVSILIIILIKTVTGSLLVSHQNSLMLFMAIMVYMAHSRVTWSADSARERVAVASDNVLFPPGPANGSRLLRHKTRDISK